MGVHAECHALQGVVAYFGVQIALTDTRSLFSSCHDKMAEIGTVSIALSLLLQRCFCACDVGIC